MPESEQRQMCVTGEVGMETTRAGLGATARDARLDAKRTRHTVRVRVCEGGREQAQLG